MSSILGICCSKRQLGNCDVLLQEALRAAEEEGARTTYLRLTELEFKPCRGCLACVYKGRCAIQDDGMNVLLEHILKADGLIVSAPTYLFAPTGIVKLVIDRSLNLSPHLEELAKRKRFAVTISVAGNRKWNYLGVEMLNLFAFALGYQVIDYMSAYAPGPGEVLLDPQNVLNARELGKRVKNVLDGEIKLKEPDTQQCPHCYSRVFRLEGGNKVSCCTCGATATLKCTDRVELVFDPLDEHGHFWTPAHRRFHLNDWVITSRDRYLSNRTKVKELLKKYRRI